MEQFIEDMIVAAKARELAKLLSFNAYGEVKLWLFELVTYLIAEAKAVDVNPKINLREDVFIIQWPGQSRADFFLTGRSTIPPSSLS